jgi:hypothetical protein
MTHRSTLPLFIASLFRNSSHRSFENNKFLAATFGAATVRERVKYPFKRIGHICFNHPNFQK